MRIASTAAAGSSASKAFASFASFTSRSSWNKALTLFVGGFVFGQFSPVGFFHFGEVLIRFIEVRCEFQALRPKRFAFRSLFDSNAFNCRQRPGVQGRSPPLLRCRRLTGGLAHDDGELQPDFSLGGFDLALQSNGRSFFKIVQGIPGFVALTDKLSPLRFPVRGR